MATSPWAELSREDRRLGLPQPVRWGAVLATLVGVVLVGVLTNATNPYITGLVVLICIYSTVTLAWNLTLGHAGLFTFGQLAFFGIGAYSSALLTIHAGVSPWLGLLFAGLVAGLAGAAIGLPSLRLYGPYLVLFTLAFQELLRVLLVTDGGTFFGGVSGVTGVEPLRLPGVSVAQGEVFVAIAMCAAAYAICTGFMRTPTGLAVEALRDSEAATISRGVNRVRHRLVVFTLSAMLTGVAGAFFAHYYRGVAPTVFDFTLTTQLLAMIVIGGLASSRGVLLGTVLIVLANDQLAGQAQYSQLLFGLLVVGIVLPMPSGIAGAARDLRARYDAWMDAEDDDAEDDDEVAPARPAVGSGDPERRSGRANGEERADGAARDDRAPTPSRGGSAG